LGQKESFVLSGRRKNQKLFERRLHREQSLIVFAQSAEVAVHFERMLRCHRARWREGHQLAIKRLY
jgi:hypothetical protein